MASAAASRPPAPPPPPPPPPAAQALQWLGPRVSFSLDDAGGGGGGGGAGREVVGGKPGASADFEFLFAGCSAVSMLPADELFSGGKLVPLRIPAPPASATSASASPEEGPLGGGVGAVAEALPKQAQQLETPRAEDEKDAKGVAAAEEPKIPARRWRDLLRLRKQQASGPSATSEPRQLRRFLRRGPKPPEPEQSLSLPLLRESGPDKPDKPEKTSPAPISTPTPPPPSQNLPPKIRLSPAQAAAAPPPPPPPSPPAAVAADSPRLNAAGKVVFNGLGRSSSSPSSLVGGRRNSAGGAIERSYSAHVRVAPVLNVPVCSLRGSRKSVSVFGIDRFFSPSSSSAAAAGKKVKAVKKEVTAASAAGKKVKAAKKEVTAAAQ